MKKGRYLWGVMVLLSVVTGPVFAQESVDAKVARLEQTIQTLERRVRALESQLLGQNAPVSAPKGKENWRKLEKGMRKAEVEQLLGSPEKIDTYRSFVIWNYGLRGGSVEFDAEASRVTSWHEPD